MAKAKKPAVKKPAKKKTAKKTARKKTQQKKKTVKKSAAKKTKTTKKKAVKAPTEASFWVYYGPVLSDIYELENALGRISNEQFAYHANKIKNDFADWIEKVLRDKGLADALRKCRTRTSAQRTTARHVKIYY